MVWNVPTLGAICDKRKVRESREGILSQTDVVLAHSFVALQSRVPRVLLGADTITINRSHYGSCNRVIVSGGELTMWPS